MNNNNLINKISKELDTLLRVMDSINDMNADIPTKTVLIVSAIKASSRKLDNLKDPLINYENKGVYCD